MRYRFVDAHSAVQLYSIKLDVFCRTIQITGSKEAAEAAQNEVYELLASGPTSEVSGQVGYMKVPDDKVCLFATVFRNCFLWFSSQVGLVIGRQGINIKEIQNRTGARIQIPTQADPGKANWISLSQQV